MARKRKSPKQNNIVSGKLAVKQTFGKGKNKRTVYRIKGRFVSEKEYKKQQLKLDIQGSGKSYQSKKKTQLKKLKKDLKPKTRKKAVRKEAYSIKTEIWGQSGKGKIQETIQDGKQLILITKEKNYEFDNSSYSLLEMFIDDLEREYINIYLTKYDLVPSPRLSYTLYESNNRIIFDLTQVVTNVNTEVDDFELDEELELADKEFQYRMNILIKKYFSDESSKKKKRKKRKK